MWYKLTVILININKLTLDMKCQTIRATNFSCGGGVFATALIGVFGALFGLVGENNVRLVIFRKM
jgi:hypothetical protein